MARLVGGEMASFIISITEDMPGRFDRAKQAVAAGVIRERTVIFADMIGSQALPGSGKSTHRLNGDEMILVPVGTKTTAVSTNCTN